MSKSKLEQAFQLFVSKDELRIGMKHVARQYDYTYATDGHALIRCKNSDCDFYVDPDAGGLSYSSVIPTVNQNTVININEEMFDKLKTEDEYTFEGENKECEACEGEGEVTWEFEHYSDEFECPVCNGSGYSEEKKGVKTGNKIFGVSSKVRLNESYFRAGIFYKLIEVQKLLGGEIVLISQSASDRASLFKIGVCEIILMPTMVDEYSKQDKDNLLEIDTI